MFSTHTEFLLGTRVRARPVDAQLNGSIDRRTLTETPDNRLQVGQLRIEPCLQVTSGSVR